MIKVEHHQSKFIYSSVLILIFASFVKILMGHKTAFDWPAIDIAPFLERYFYPSFAINDFFTIHDIIREEAFRKWIEISSHSCFLFLYLIFKSSSFTAFLRDATLQWINKL